MTYKPIIATIRYWFIIHETTDNLILPALG